MLLHSTRFPHFHINTLIFVLVIQRRVVVICIWWVANAACRWAPTVRSEASPSAWSGATAAKAH